MIYYRRYLITCLSVAILWFAPYTHGQSSNSRILFVGNSITYHGSASKVGWLGTWGMAASTMEKDYVHRVLDSLTVAADKPMHMIANAVPFEKGYAAFNVAANYRAQIAFDPNIIIVALGENVPTLTTPKEKAAFKSAFQKLLQALMKGEGEHRLFVRSCFWRNEVKDEILESVCNSLGGVFVDISQLGQNTDNYARSERDFSNKGVGNHPGDKGMQAIADAIVEAIKTDTAKKSAMIKKCDTLIARIKFSTKKTFPFPNMIFGTGQPIFEMSYNSDAVWKKACDTGITSLRYPHGTQADHFLWDDPERGYWGSYAQSRIKMHPDAFMAICRRLDVEPIITVNSSSYGYPIDVKRINPMDLDSIRKGAEYAARWVKKQNLETDQPVTYWEVGNEAWIWLKANEYPVYVNEYAKAMRAVDPSIKILAQGLSYDRRPFHVSWLDFPDFPGWEPRDIIRNYGKEWTQALIDQANGSFDYMVLHIYMNGSSMNAIDNGRELFFNIHECSRLDMPARLLKESGCKAKIAVTEWCINMKLDPLYKKYFSSNGFLTTDQVETLSYDNSPSFMFVTALLGADFLGRMISSGIVEMASLHDLSSALVRRYNHEAHHTPKQIINMPQGIAMEFWSEFAGEQVLPVTVTDSPVYKYHGYSIPLVSSYATLSASNSVSLILINRSPNQIMPVYIPATLNGLSLVEATEHTVSAKSWATDLRVAMEDLDAKPIQRMSAPLSPTDLTSSPYQLKPSALTCLKLQYK
jgi:alpha-galactosidase